MQNISILGATGSIGLSTLDVIARHPNEFSLYAVTGNTNVEQMLSICREYNPSVAVMVDETSAESLQVDLSKLGLDIQVLAGEDALNTVASHPQVDTVMAAIVGGAGLKSTFAAATAGKRILLANKESLVMSGELLLEQCKRTGAQLLPVDSEHNAIFQVLPQSVQQGGDLTEAGVSKIILTGSGGPFLNTDINEFDNITPAMAVAHPNWSMGQKISVDSATMMNKGLEFVEARLLFSASFEQIQVLIHPQSIIHSMVSYEDGSVLAQMGQPDMRIPIAHCLGYPNRIESGVAPLDFTQVADFTFKAPDFERFPNLRLALESSKLGQAATTVLNAANEISVDAFLNKHISFNDIARLNEKALVELSSKTANDLTQILELDKETRRFCSDLIRLSEV